MDGRMRLSTYKKRGGLSQAERRRQLADKRREAVVDRRFRVLAEQRGLDIPESTITASSTPAPSRVQKLQEWIKKKNAAKKVEDTSVKPAFKTCSKVRYDDTHLYKPPESTKFNAPKGVVAIKPTLPQRQLRSQTKKNGPSRAVTTALEDFASAMKAKTLPNKENHISEVLNRTFDASDITENQILTVGFPSKADELKVSDNTSSEQVPEISGGVESDPRPSSSIVKCSDAHVKASYCDELLPVIEKLKCETIPTPADNTRRNTRSKSSRKSKKVSLKVETELDKENDPVNGQVILEGCTGDGSNPDKMVQEKSAEYFWSLYKEAADKLTNLCAEWNNLISEDMPESVKDKVDVAIGYANLLRSQRLQQYAELITEHENKTDETELKVLPSDLEGFWNVVNNQLQDIYKKFEELSHLKANEWKLPAQGVQEIKNKPRAVKASKAKGKTTSGLRSFLAQARRKVKGENDMVNILDNTDDLPQMPLLKPMSPVVMKVALRAKQLGSPKVGNSATRSPLKNANHIQVTFSTPQLSEKKTPRRRTRNFTPGSTPLRRSTRLASCLLEDLN